MAQGQPSSSFEATRSAPARVEYDQDGTVVLMLTFTAEGGATMRVRVRGSAVAERLILDLQKVLRTITHRPPATSE